MNQFNKNKAEPVAWLYERKGGLEKIEPETVTLKRLPDNGTWKAEFPLIIQDHKLRKAAEDAELLLTELEAGYGFETNDEYEVLDNLRAALEGK